MSRGDRVHEEVRALLPSYVDLSLGRVRRSLVAGHLRRCAACQAEFSKQRAVADGLASLAGPVDAPPDGLLEQLLAQSSSPRGAAPLRGAVSGARPAYSAALLAAGAVTAAGAGYASWLSAKHLRKRLRR
jgi:predicted anti-sigma-YlaC factor YlaD